ncbi:MAG: hypothetical protein V3U71_05410, partial [Cocleimonas sp.]
MKNILITHILLVLSLSACAVTLDLENKEYKLSDTLANNAKVSVIIETVSIGKEFIYGKPIWWGAELIPPKTITSNISVTLDSNPCWVRFSAYSDLVNIKTAKLIVLKNGFQVTINGGESATHYIAYLNFDNDGFLI